MNNKKAIIKNVITVVLGLLFFLLIIKFFPVVSNPDYQNAKNEEISGNFKAEALKYGGISTSAKQIVEVNTGTTSVTSKTGSTTATVGTTTKKTYPSKPSQNFTTGTTSTSPTSNTSTTPKPTPKPTPTPTITITPESPTTNTTPTTTADANPKLTTTNTSPENITDTNPEDTTTTPESSDGEISTGEESQDSVSHESGNNSSGSISANSGSTQNNIGHQTTGYVPGVLIGPQISEKINNVVETLPAPIKEKIEKAGKTATVATAKTAEVVSSTSGQTVTVAVTSAGAVAGASVSASAALSVNALAFSDSLFGIIRLWGVFLSALGLRKKNKPWGSVYDSVTKQPLDPVYVSLENMEGKEVASAITDLDGRYGFLTQAGSYKLNVHKNNYEFPSKKAMGKSNDQIYSDLYFGEIINISNDGEVVTKNIPMDSLKFDWNEFEKNRRKLMKFYSKRNVMFVRIADILFSLGLLITIISTITSPKVYSIVVLVIYIILYIVRGFSIKSKSYGSIIEKEGGSPLSFGIIHVKKSSDEIVHKVANKIGRFYCLVPNGVYEISIDKKISDEEYVEIYKEDGYEVKNGHINKKFQV